MNPWRRGPLTRNPYARTPFRVARVPREVTRRKTLLQIIGQTENLLSAGHEVGGEPVTQAELNATAQVLLDAKQRILAELLEHATERPPLERVRRLAREAAETMAAETESPTPEADAATPCFRNLRALDIWAQHLAQKFLEQADAPDASFGAFELTPVPPFGRRSI
jgi:hypothetical protein